MKKNMSLNEQQVGNLGVMNSNKSSLLMQQMLERSNLHCALKQVQRNKGAPGVDGMTVDDLPEYLKHNWLKVREALLNGTYKPNPVRRVEIPKPNGAKRKLGIPTVLDLDLQSFFDEVNHDRLMSQLKSNGTNSDVLRLINSYLKTPVLSEHGRIKTTKGVPQGRPLSPLLSNIVLNEMDWELQSRGLSFVRYADDCQILVGSQRAGERILANLTRFLEQKLKLKVNQEKSAVDHVWNRTFLGLTLLRKDLRIKVSAKAQKSLKTKVRMITRRTRGHAFLSVVSELKESLLGWKAYFDISEVLSPLKDLDKWIRRKLRCYLLKQWGRSGYRKLRQLGIDRYLAWNTAKSAHGPWRLSHSPALYKALPNRYFRGLGCQSWRQGNELRFEPPWYVIRMPGGVGGGAL